MSHRKGNEPQVSVVVLTWNQRDLTLACLESLGAVDYPPGRVELIVVDNGSTDGTAQAISDRFPHAAVLQNPDNLGFAEGNNVGIRYALRGDTDYIMLLNNDTVVDPTMLKHLISVAERDDHAGIVTPKIYYFDQPNLIWCAGASINWQTGAVRRQQAEEVDVQPDAAVREVDFASGCAICVKRQVIEEIGLLDPRFFIYYEETDWCVRAQAGGWRILYVPEAKLWHKVSAAMGKTSPATDYYMNRNVLLFLAKNRSGTARFRALARAAGRNLLAAAAYTAKSHDRQRLPNRNARLFALRDALLGRWGKMSPDVAAVCYPDGR